MVFSTYVEVILAAKSRRLTSAGFLHVCGGDPAGGVGYGRTAEFSPRMWRWSSCWYRFVHKESVFSTYVEVIPNDWGLWLFRTSFLHVCGGDPMTLVIQHWWSTFSPRMWRWSLTPVWSYGSISVFSTYVEVILTLKHQLQHQFRFLHVCGGDPI